MSNIVLSASVRQNLLSLQSTAELLATTQERLSTGKKVNTALDNPTNFFTAQGLDNRASDINNLLDGIANGVQVLQAANTGITSLQKLVDTAKSIASQALQATSGYDTRATLTSAAITGLTATNLTGSAGATSSATNTGTALTSTGTTVTAQTVTGSTLTADTLTSAITASKTGTALHSYDAAKLTTGISDTGASGFAAGDSFTISTGAGNTIVSFYSGAAPAPATNTVFVDVATLGATGDATTIATAITGGTSSSGVAASVVGGKLTLTAANTGTSLTVTDNSPSSSTLFNGVAGVSGATVTANATANGAGATPTGTSLVSDLGIKAGDTFTVNGTTVTVAGGDTINGLLTKINTAAGGTVASFATGQFSLTSTASIANVSVQDGTAGTVAKLGLTGNNTVASTPAGTPPTVSAATLLKGTASNTSNDLSTAITAGSTLVVNGTKTISFYDSGAGGAAGSAANTTYLDLATSRVGDVLGAIDAITGGTSSVSAAGKLQLGTGTTDDFSITGTGNALTALGLNGTLAVSGGSATTLAAGATLAKYAAPAPITATTSLSGLTNIGNIADGSSFIVNGKTITFSTSAATSTNSTGSTINLTSGKVQDLLDAVDKAQGTYNYVTQSGASSVSANGELKLATGTASNLVIAASSDNSDATVATKSAAALGALGLAAGTTAVTGSTTSGLTGKTLHLDSFGGGTALDITFGTGTGQINTLDALNTVLAGNNLRASIDSSSHTLSITSTNDYASQTFSVSGTAITDSGSAFQGKTVSAPVPDADAQNARASLVAQFNNVIDQIRTTSQDASFNGVNLLNGDQLKLVFNETGTSTLNIPGSVFDPVGLGLSALTAGVDLVDGASTKAIVSALNGASTALRSAASTLGSNLSVVQIRQDFNKNLINVLQTGSSNLTLADTNEEAANSQALSTRQSIAVSALSLANQSQQSVLQLLR
ncbi:flagellin [Bradyrhizobium cosmicum]|uniref:Flagellin n=1 Tax=Bradyrhizobium cosmicum TaxID=1404864 RepID=A0AAI8MBN1_9BRAD|nr:flagellin [Bradyrhizobium cosmicum]BAL75616.1 flagellin [Bradyrhizobium cosmicum]